MAIHLQILQSMLVGVLMLAMTGVFAADKISLHALFKDKAIVIIDGKRYVLDRDEVSPEGVKLLATDTTEEEAEIEIDGKREKLKLGVVISGFAASGKGKVTLYPDSRGHFFINGTINGASVRFLVDTGASSVTMGRSTANRVGLNYRENGQVGYSNTAAGVVPKYYLKLNKVQVGEITLFNIDGGVIEDMATTDVLLGMSFLRQLDMRRDDSKMELSER